MNKQQTLNYLLERNILLSPELLHQLPEEIDTETLLQLTKDKFKTAPLILNQDLYSSSGQSADIHWQDYDTSRALHEKGKQSTYSKFMEHITPSSPATQTAQLQEQVQLEKIETLPPIKNESKEGTVTIIKSYTEEGAKRDVQDFVSHFKARYESIKKILLARPELQNSISISRAAKKAEREQVSIIGMISEKRETKKGNIMLHLEDPSGIIKVVLSKSKPETFELAQDLVLDEVIGITGSTGDNIIFANTIYFPDIPLNHELKKAPDEAYAVFVSDIHFGLNLFLEQDFLKFIEWLKGDYGTEHQREMAKKVKYLFVVGDIVEGIGIYPGQEQDLTQPDIYGQYEIATKYFKMVPEHIKIIICGGNHDAMRIAEPQPIFDPKICKGFYEIHNMIMVSNPAVVNIHSSDGFPGFNVLMYHGFSLPFYGDNIQSIRQKGGMDRCDLILKFYLQRRHLAPTHGSNLYMPDPKEDPLVIDIVPDIIATGHIHRIVAGNYRNVTFLNSSCWANQSDDQARRGIVPNPAKIPVINLKTREIKIMNFKGEANA
ncbi:MAG: metallophosphoesterase [Candidatus Nanoarchaeia archaeon]